MTLAPARWADLAVVAADVEVALEDILQDTDPAIINPGWHGKTATLLARQFNLYLPRDFQALWQMCQEAVAARYGSPYPNERTARSQVRVSDAQISDRLREVLPEVLAWMEDYWRSNERLHRIMNPHVEVATEAMVAFGLAGSASYWYEKRGDDFQYLWLWADENLKRNPEYAHLAFNSARSINDRPTVTSMPRHTPAFDERRGEIEDRIDAEMDDWAGPNQTWHAHLATIIQEDMGLPDIDQGAVWWLVKTKAYERYGTFYPQRSVRTLDLRPYLGKWIAHPQAGQPSQALTEQRERIADALAWRVEEAVSGGVIAPGGHDSIVREVMAEFGLHAEADANALYWAVSDYLRQTYGSHSDFRTVGDYAPPMPQYVLDYIEANIDEWATDQPTWHAQFTGHLFEQFPDRASRGGLDPAQFYAQVTGAIYAAAKQKYGTIYPQRSVPHGGVRLGVRLTAEQRQFVLDYLEGRLDYFLPPATPHPHVQMADMAFDELQEAYPGISLAVYDEVWAIAEKVTADHGYPPASYSFPNLVQPARSARLQPIGVWADGTPMYDERQMWAQLPAGEKQALLDYVDMNIEDYPGKPFEGWHLELAIEAVGAVYGRDIYDPTSKQAYLMRALNLEIIKIAKQKWGTPYPGRTAPGRRFTEVEKAYYFDDDPQTEMVSLSIWEVKQFVRGWLDRWMVNNPLNEKDCPEFGMCDIDRMMMLICSEFPDRCSNANKRRYTQKVVAELIEEEYSHMPWPMALRSASVRSAKLDKVADQVEAEIEERVRDLQGDPSTMWEGWHADTAQDICNQFGLMSYEDMETIWMLVRMELQRVFGYVPGGDRSAPTRGTRATVKHGVRPDEEALFDWIREHFQEYAEHGEDGWHLDLLYDAEKATHTMVSNTYRYQDYWHWIEDTSMELYGSLYPWGRRGEAGPMGGPTGRTPGKRTLTGSDLQRVIDYVLAAMPDIHKAREAWHLDLTFETLDALGLPDNQGNTQQVWKLIQQLAKDNYGSLYPDR